MALFSWLSGGSGNAKHLLASYADAGFVHAGAPGALSPKQRDENLIAFVASIDRRMSRLRAFAAALGTALPVPDGDRSKVEAISQALDRLCKSRLSGLAIIDTVAPRYQWVIDKTRYTPATIFSSCPLLPMVAMAE